MKFTTVAMAAGAALAVPAAATGAAELNMICSAEVAICEKLVGAFEAGHVPGAVNLPRGQLELRVNTELPDPTVRIVTCCEFGKISTLAAATLRDLGYGRAVALDGGMKAWREAGYDLEI